MTRPAVSSGISTLTAAERASLTALGGIVERLGAVIDHETATLRANGTLDLNVVNQSKRHGLLELSRLVPQLTPSLLKGGAMGPLQTLAEKLERNQQTLDVQVRAVREVAEIIARTLREAESDGTYSGRAGRP